jgi:hypothetical protein
MTLGFLAIGSMDASRRRLAIGRRGEVWGVFDDAGRDVRLRGLGRVLGRGSEQGVWMMFTLWFKLQKEIVNREVKRAKGFPRVGVSWLRVVYVPRQTSSECRSDCLRCQIVNIHLAENASPQLAPPKRHLRADGSLWSNVPAHARRKVSPNLKLGRQVQHLPWRYSNHAIRHEQIPARLVK